MAVRKGISPLLAGRVHLGTVPDPEAQSGDTQWRRAVAAGRGASERVTSRSITVAILAGGLGTRLSTVVADRPKVLADVGGRPFLSWWLDALERQGFGHVVLCAGYKAEQLRQTLGSKRGNLQLQYSIEPRPLGTGGALRHALPLLSSNPVLVLNGDSFCDVDLRVFLAEHFERGAQASLVTTAMTDTSRFGRISVRPDGSVQAFREKESDAGPGSINAGIYLFARELLAAVPEARNISLERDLLPIWIARDIHVFSAAGPFLDIGTPESLASAEAFFARLNRPAA
jgi:D-glycero-alpha-D-manno-heptose 1-phosphate guanylyltransferase